MVDGSGLDRGDRISCATFTQVLEADGVNGVIAERPAGRRRPRHPQAAVPDSPAASKVKAKTGTLHDVNSLSGWVTTDHGRPLIFSIITQTGDVLGSRVLDQRLTEATALATPTRPTRRRSVPVPGRREVSRLRSRRDGLGRAADVPVGLAAPAVDAAATADVRAALPRQFAHDVVGRRRRRSVS